MASVAQSPTIALEGVEGVGIFRSLNCCLCSKNVIEIDNSVNFNINIDYSEF